MQLRTGLFLCLRILKNGKDHRYWSVVENKRCAGNRIVQRHVLCLGELNEGQLLKIMNLTRNGKIARLPKAIREELNRRLDNGEQGRPLRGDHWAARLKMEQEPCNARNAPRPFRAAGMPPSTSGRDAGRHLRSTCPPRGWRTRRRCPVGSISRCQSSSCSRRPTLKSRLKPVKLRPAHLEGCVSGWNTTTYEVSDFTCQIRLNGYHYCVCKKN